MSKKKKLAPNHFMCAHCKGKGFVTRPHQSCPFIEFETTCDDCNGTGELECYNGNHDHTNGCES